MFHQDRRPVSDGICRSAGNGDMCPMSVPSSEYRKDKRTLVIAGGGTGGHLFPGIAIARQWIRGIKDADVLFIVGHRKIETEIISRYGYQTAYIDVEGIKGRGLNAVNALLKLPVGILQSVRILRSVSPDVVIGMGGYSSGPVCLSARMMGIPAAIHEQNSYPGVTNRLLARFVNLAFLSFRDSSKYLKARSYLLVGTPVRDEIIRSGESEHRIKKKGFTILVTGGSQGARALNIEVANALALLKDMGRDINVIHQTGQIDYERCLKDYETRGIKADLSPFITDMASAYNAADLVISRAGASSIFELAALRKPSVLIPYPYAANQHQMANAMSLSRIGAAEVIDQSDLSGPGLARIIIKYMDNPGMLEDMGQRAGKMARTDAAEQIVNGLKQICSVH